MKVTKLSHFFIFRSSNHRISNLILAEKDGKTTLCYAKNNWNNIIFSRALLKWCEKHIINKHIVDTSNDFTIQDSMVNKFTINKPLVFRKHLLITNYDFSDCSVEVFWFVRDLSIILIFLLPHNTNLRKPLDITIFVNLANVYCLERDQWQQSEKLNINWGDFPKIIKCAREKAVIETYIKSVFEAKGV